MHALRGPRLQIVANRAIRRCAGNDWIVAGQREEPDDVPGNDTSRHRLCAVQVLLVGLAHSSEDRAYPGGRIHKHTITQEEPMNLRMLGKNACFYAAGTIGLRTAAFLLIPVYTHTFSTGEYGLLAVLLQTAQIMVIVIGMGSRTALIRFTKEYQDKNRTGVLLGTSVVINLLGALAVTAIASLAAPLFKGILHSERVFGYVLLTCVGA